MIEVMKGVYRDESKNYEIFLDASDWGLMNQGSLETFAAAEELSMSFQETLNQRVVRHDAYVLMMRLLEKHEKVGGRNRGPREMVVKVLDKVFGVK